MQDILQLLNGITSLMCASLIAVVVLCSHVQEGPVIKLGLILMVIGLLASGVILLKGFDTAHGLWNAALLTRLGLLIVLLGYAWRMGFKQKGKL